MWLRYEVTSISKNFSRVNASSDVPNFTGVVTRHFVELVEQAHRVNGSESYALSRDGTLLAYI